MRAENVEEGHSIVLTQFFMQFFGHSNIYIYKTLYLEFSAQAFVSPKLHLGLLLIFQNH